MSNNFIKMDGRMEIIDLHNESFMTVVDLVNEKCILVKILLRDGQKPKPKLSVGEDIKVFIYKNGSAYSGNCTVVGIKEQKKFTHAVLTLPKDMKKIERRKYFRLPINMNIDYIILPNGFKYSQLKDIPLGFLVNLKQTETIDISGGGLKINCSTSPEVGQMILVSLYIPEEIKLLTTVVRVEKNSNKGNYKVSLKFENISEKTRDKIIEFIFNEMRKVL